MQCAVCSVQCKFFNSVQFTIVSVQCAVVSSNQCVVVFRLR